MWKHGAELSHRLLPYENLCVQNKLFCAGDSAADVGTIGQFKTFFCLTEKDAQQQIKENATIASINWTKTIEVSSVLKA